mgnify:CR=1 FL=1
MENLNGELDAVVQAKIDEDTEFAESIASLSDEEKATAIAEKREEIIKSEWRNLTEFAKTRDQVAKDKEAWAKKLEKEGKQEKKETKTDGDLTPMDVIFLSKSPIASEDMPELLEYAKAMKLPVSEAYEKYKPILDVKEEKRKSAGAANTTATRRSVDKVSDEKLLADFSKGEVPEPGSPEAKRLFELRRKK